MDQLIAALPYLACPVGMGLMMWMMSRRRQDGVGAGAAQAPASVVSPRATARDEQLSELREELARVQAQQEAISREIKAVSAVDTVPVVRDAEGAARGVDRGAAR